MTTQRTLSDFFGKPSTENKNKRKLESDEGEEKNTKKVKTDEKPESDTPTSAKIEKSEKLDKGKKEEKEEKENEPTLLDIKKLLEFDGSKFKTDQEFEGKFREIAHHLLNNVLLYINEKPYRLCEIEFYYCGYAHPDLFTHKDTNQKKSATWYFHRTNNVYRDGNYKGIDITFGGNDNNKFGGILIRCIEELPSQSKPNLIDGPCLSVNRILSLNGVESIPVFVSKNGEELDVTTTKGLYLTFATTPEQKKLIKVKRDILVSPRVGLSPTKHKPDQFKYIMREYRYLTQPLHIKKGKQNMVAALLGAKLNIQRISTITGCNVKTLESYTRVYEQAKANRNLGKFDGVKIEGGEDVIELYGMCSPVVPVPTSSSSNTSTQ